MPEAVEALGERITDDGACQTRLYLWREAGLLIPICHASILKDSGSSPPTAIQPRRRTQVERVGSGG
jgi:hypothetical protein